MVFQTESIWQKLSEIASAVDNALSNRLHYLDHNPRRDILVLPPNLHPPKMGLSLTVGKARLLHDLANIELQAMELALRTLIEYPEAPDEFRQELSQLVLSEAEHLKMCLEGIASLGYSWGHWPVHMALWDSVSTSDSLLDRILIVHRYLEGSGLDAGETILRRLSGVDEDGLNRIVSQIVREEIDHVEFGSRWYRKICKMQKLDPNDDFKSRFLKIKTKVPKRIERLSRDLRLQAGFTEEEINFLEFSRRTLP